MLKHPTSERLAALGLAGMARALDEQRGSRNVEGLDFEERLALLVDRETAERETKRLSVRLKAANLRQDAAVEDLDPTTKRGLDKALFAKLATGEWIGRRQDLIVTGKTGTGKSWVACALGHKACRDDRSVLYCRVPRLLDDLTLARGDGRLVRRMKLLARVDLLILDDWGLSTMTSAQGRDILEIVDDRHGRRSTIVTSQLPVEKWHDVIPDPTVADAVLDRLVHTAHRLDLKGETLRNPQNKTPKRG
jgi:DNA replication protein DnaC